MEYALDCISDLFARDREGKFHRIVHYFSPLLDSIAGDSREALPALRKLVVSSAKQSLVNELRISDPTGWKIYRNLTGAVQRNPAILTFQRFDTNYYFLKDSGTLNIPDDLHPDRPEISIHDAFSLVHHFTERPVSTPALVEHILRNLEHLDLYQNFLSQNILFQILKRHLGVNNVPFDDKWEMQGRNHNRPEELSKEQIDSLFIQLQEFISQEIKYRFSDKDRITDVEYQAYSTIIREYFRDLIHDGYPEKIPQYRSITDLIHYGEADWKTHRGRIEYLIKLGRSELKRLTLQQEIFISGAIDRREQMK